MQGFYRDLFKHSSVYGLGQVLGRLASVIMLPVYTNYLLPEDYGVIALLDFAAGIMAILIGAGIGAAITRYHFAVQDEEGRNQVWWTGLSIVMMTGAAVLLLTMFFREPLAELTLGAQVTQGAFFYALVLPTLWLNVVGRVLDNYLRVRKWSGTSVGVNFICLVLNIGLNVYFLVALDLGVAGILTGNLLAGGVSTFILLVIFLKNQESYSFHYPFVGKLLRFGGPLILTAVLSSLMHQADRYLLRLYTDLDQVGIYSLAYTISQGVYFLCFMPFTMIWRVLVYEIADHSDAKQNYIQVFEYSTYGLALIMLGVALFAKPILALMVAPAFLPAADLIPIGCLAFLLFSFHEHFKIPVVLAKSTVTLVPVVIVAVLINIGVNMLLIPIYGIAGAAWASVITYGAYSFGGLWCYRRVDKYDYPLLKCLIIVFGMVASFGMYDRVVHLDGVPGGPVFLAIFLWVGWLVFLFGSFLRQLAARYVWVHVKIPIFSSRDHSR